MLGVLEGFSIIAVVIAVGYLVARLRVLDANAGQTLTRFAFFVAMPALMFTTLARSDLNIIFSARLPVAAFSCLGVMAIYLLIFRVFLKKPLAQTVIASTGSGMLNANNMGMPVAIYVFGDPAQIAPVLLFQLIFLTPPLLAVMDMIAYQRKLTFASVVSQPFKNPLVIGAMLGILVNASNLPIPELVFEPFDILGGAGIPLILVSFGMSLRGNKPLTDPALRAETFVAVFLKVAGMPLLAYLGGRFIFNLAEADLIAATVLAGLPTAQNLFNYASRYQQSVVLCRDIVLLSTLAAVPFMLLVSYLLHTS